MPAHWFLCDVYIVGFPAGIKEFWFPNYVYNDMLEIMSILMFEGASVAEHIF
jgi:hypothetical protein